MNELSNRLPAVEAEWFMKCRIPTSIKLRHLTCFQWEGTGSISKNHKQYDWVNLGGWLHTGLCTCPQTVTHPSINWAWRRITCWLRPTLIHICRWQTSSRVWLCGDLWTWWSSWLTVSSRVAATLSASLSFCIGCRLWQRLRLATVIVCCWTDWITMLALPHSRCCRT